MIAAFMFMFANLLAPVYLFALELTYIDVHKSNYGNRPMGAMRVAVAARFRDINLNRIHMKNSRLTAVENWPGLLFFHFLQEIQAR